MKTPFEAVLLICILCSCIAISCMVIRNNRNSVIHRSFAVFLVGVSFMTFGFFALIEHYPFLVFDRFINYGGLVIVLGLFLFMQVFPNGVIDIRKKIWLYLPFALIAVFVIPFNLLTQHAVVDETGMIHQTAGPLLFPYLLFCAAYLVASFGIFIRKYKNTQGIQKLQMQYVGVGMVILLCALFILDLLLPVLHVTKLAIFGIFFAFVFIVLTAVAIVKHKLLDIRIVIQRSLIYVILFTLIVGVYFAGLQILGWVLERVTNSTAIISAGITTVLGVFFIQPLRQYFQKITDPFFFKHKYVYSDAIAMLSRMLNTTMSQADVVTASAEALADILKAKWVEFFIDEIPEPKPDLALSLPIIFEEKNIGTIALGPKRSGDDYDYQDMQLLETFLHQAAVALEKGRLYEKVEEYSTQLERIVEERTKEIKRVQEEQKRNMIDISHNLQTPLAVIRGELELMQEYSTDQGKIVAVKRSLMRVSEFIRQLLHLARLDTSVYNIPFTTLNLSDLVEEQAEYFEVMGYEHHLNVTASIEPDIMFTGNKRLLEEALTNIAHNAIKYCREDVESRMNIELYQTDAEIVLNMEDNGIGIEQAHLADIFNRFYRTSGAIQKKTQGVGLGLAIVQKIVEMHGGTITAKSTVGTGTCFTITFKK